MASLRELGDQLRRAGLTQNALLAWAGTHRISALPLVMPRGPAKPATPAAAVLALFVGGVDLSRSFTRALPIDALVEHGLVTLAHDTARANVSILPLEQTLLVADRLDADVDRDHVCWPDDSSYHLASAIAPGRRDRWIDLATGSAFAPLTRPSLATSITGIDLNARAIAYARLGAGLSGCAHFEARCADIGEITRACESGEDTRGETQRAALVTCNAPIPDDPDASIWRSTDRAFFDRLWSSARACAAPGGEIIVHCVLDAIPDLDGEALSVVYTPPSERAYAITWWRPDAPARREIRHRALTAARPHVDPRDAD